jgi:hypothetical protein
MKIIITKGQVDLIREKTNKSLNLIMKYYDIEDNGSTYRGDNKIQTYVTFYPKDYDNEMTRESATSTCNWKINEDNEPVFIFMTIPHSRDIPLMDYIGDTEDLEEYLEGIHKKEADVFVKRIIHRRNNPLNESIDKNKKFLTKVMGQDFTGKIKEVKDPYDVPLEFGETIGDDYIRRVLNYFGPLYLVDIDGKKYLYQYRTDEEDGDYEWFHDEHGFNYVDGEIPEQLGISDMGLKFSDIIDMFINEGEPLNEEYDMPEKSKENTKIKNLLKKVLENKEFEYSFTDRTEGVWDGYEYERVEDDYTFKYHMVVNYVLGVGSGSVADISVIIDDFILDGESVYSGWSEIGYSENVWYIEHLHEYLNDDVFNVFPFSIYPTFYGHDEEK